MMGNPSPEKVFHISEITLNPTSNHLATITCCVPEDCQLSILIQNQSGVLRYEKHFQLQAGNHILDLDIKNLEEGLHHAWIDAMGKTVIRTILIEDGSANRHGWVNRIKNLFK